jgi:hypothetical protein
MSDVIWWRNCYMCPCGIASIEDRVEPELRKLGSISSTIRIFQGAWNAGGVSGSAGTHDGGGAIDTDRYDSDAELTVWREAGWAAWGRGNDKYGDGFDPHNHAICNGCPDTSSGADNQLDDYDAGRNGLANNGKDPGPDVRPLPDWDDALNDYEGEGLFGMTEKIYGKRSTDYAAKNDGEWHDCYINEDGDTSAVIGTTSQVTCSGLVIVTGLIEGEAFDLTWRIASYDANVKPTEYSHTRSTYARGLGLAGRSVSVGRVYNGSVPKDDAGNSPRLRLSYRTTAAAAQITSVTVEGWATSD